MRFGDSQMLWLLLLVLPPMSLFLGWAWRKRQRLIAQFVRSRLLAELTLGVSRRRQKIRIALLVAAVACIIFALARPQWGFEWEEAKQKGLDIIVAIDVSRSMLAEDIRPNRLARSKLAALDLVRLARTDRLGLIAFAGTAFLQSPLTMDDDAFRQSLDALNVGIMPQGGTALAEAIETAMTAFKREKNNFKVLVLFTDGEDHESGAVEAAARAAKADLKIFTIGVGTPEGDLLRERSAKGAGESNYIKDPEGNVVKSRLNEDLLREIATKGNGFYLPLQGARTMDVLYERALAPLPRSEISSKPVKRFYERFQWPLALAIALLVLEMFFPERRRVPQSAPPVAASANAELRKAVALLMVLLWPALGGASPRSAQRQYEKGDYDAALKEYQRLKERKPDDARLQFNAGAAAYRSKDYEEALKDFAAAAHAPDDLDLQQRAYYNLGNTLYRVGEQAADPANRIKVWEESLKQFEAAVKLKEADADARFNRDYVQQRLKELKKQQPQQDQQNKSQQQQQKSEDKSSQQNQSPDKNQQSPPQQSEQKPQPQPQAGKESDEQKKEDQNRADQREKQDGQSRPPEKKSAGSDGQPGKEDNADQSSDAVPLGQMTPQQARQMLDAQKNNERALIFVPPEKAKPRNRVIKDW